MFANFDFDVIRRSLGYLFFDGMTFTLTLTGLGALGGLIFGTLIALMRLSGLKVLGWIAGLYVDLMRSLPLVLGLSYSQTMRYVVLPQAFRNMLPVLLTQVIVLFQDTSLVYVLSIPDFLGAASKVAQRDGRLVEMYLFAALVYFVISSIASFGVRRLQTRIAYVH